MPQITVNDRHDAICDDELRLPLRFPLLPQMRPIAARQLAGRLGLLVRQLVPEPLACLLRFRQCNRQIV